MKPTCEQLIDGPAGGVLCRQPAAYRITGGHWKAHYCCDQHALRTAASVQNWRSPGYAKSLETGETVELPALLDAKATK